jgi:predicted ATPase
MELQTAHELAEQMMHLAQSVQDRYLLSLAHDALGWTLSALGELTSARTHAEQGIALYDPQTHPHSTGGSPDPRVDCLSYGTWALWLLGYPDQALKRNHEALALAEGLSHPFSLAYALAIGAVLHSLRREGQLARERAEALMTLATEQGFPFYLAWGTQVQGWALAEQGQMEEGIAQMRQSRIPSILAQLAEAYGKVGQVEEGLTILAKALAFVDKTGNRRDEAELYRVKGTLTLQSKTSLGQVSDKSQASQDMSEVPSPQPPTPSTQAEAEAEACFHKAIEVACRQSAKSWELRAVMSLSRLWQSQGKKDDARQMLAEIYGWFTEGFDTKDLQEARALLEELSH